MPRRPSIVQERLVFTIDHPEVSADTTIKFYLVPTGRKFRLVRALYINPTGLAEHADNWFEVAVKKGSTTMATRNSDADGAGDNSFTADTFLSLTPQSGSALVADSGETLSLVLDETGTATLPAGKLVVEGRLL